MKLLREEEATGVHERGEVGGNFRGHFLEFFFTGIARHLEALRRCVRSHRDDGAVAWVRGGGIGQCVEGLLWPGETVDADIENQIGTYRFPTDQQTARAILLISLGKNAANPHTLFRKDRARRKTPRVVARLRESPNNILRYRVDQRVGLIGGTIFRGSARGIRRLRC